MGYKKMIESAYDIVGRNDNPKLILKILNSHIPSAIDAIANELNITERDMLWGFGGLDIRIVLAGVPNFIYSLSDGQARDVIQMNTPFISQYVAENMPWKDVFEILEERAKGGEHDDFEDDENEGYGPRRELRISKKIFEKLYKFILKNKYICVRNGLISNDNVFEDILPSFEKCLDLGIYNFNVSVLKMKDLPLIKKCSKEVFLNIAENIHDIEDNNLQNALAELIISHRDPEVRLELIDNYLTPTCYLKRLLDDPEPDVVKEAKNRLDFEDEYDDEDCEDDACESGRMLPASNMLKSKDDE